MRTRGRRPEGPEDENPYWISYSDLMSSMLFLFLLAVVVLIFAVNEQNDAAVEAQKAAELAQAEREDTKKQLEAQILQIAAGETVRAEMVSEIATSLEALGIEAATSEDGAILSIPSSVLGFDGASYDIKPQYEKQAIELGKKIAQAMAKDERASVIDTITIEGHTDNIPHEGLEGTGNWGLSTFRAISLWQLWDSKLTGQDRLTDLTNDGGDSVLSVSGYAETRPVQKTQKTDSQRAQNRRIDVRFLLKPPSSENVTSALDNIMKDSES